MLSKLLSRQGVRDLFLGLALLCATLSLMLYPQDSMSAAREGLKLCYNVIIPSLFPFFVLSALVVDLGVAGYIGRALEGLMRPLFNVPGACASAFVLGFVGGYPVGARTALSLYQKGMCTKTEAERLLSFCNNSGPAFILGVVGAGCSPAAGWASSSTWRTPPHPSVWGCFSDFTGGAKKAARPGCPPSSRRSGLPPPLPER